jgi:hypothetical protein
MNPPPSNPNPDPKPAPPTPPKRVIIEDHTWRNTLIAVGAGIVVLIFVGYGVLQMGSPVKGNKLTGTIVEKVFTEQKESQVAFSGRKIEGVKEIAGEYVLRVRVEVQKRTYDVPVEQYVYDSKKVGDPLTFIRPPSEQK